MESYSKHIITKYYKKYKYAFPEKGRASADENKSVKTFRKIRRAFFVFNLVASMIAMAIALVFIL